MRPSSSIDKDMNRQVVSFVSVRAVEDIDDACDFGLALVAVELKVLVVDVEIKLLA